MCLSLNFVAKYVNYCTLLKKPFEKYNRNVVKKNTTLTTQNRTIVGASFLSRYVHVRLCINDATLQFNFNNENASEDSS